MAVQGDIFETTGKNDPLNLADGIEIDLGGDQRSSLENYIEVVKVTTVTCQAQGSTSESMIPTIIGLTLCAIAYLCPDTALRAAAAALGSLLLGYSVVIRAKISWLKRWILIRRQDWPGGR